MPNGERATQMSDGECGKTMVPQSGSSKNDAQLLCQNIIQNVLRKTGETGDDASRSVTPIGHSTETGGVVCWFFSTLVSVSFGVLLPVASRHSPQWLHRACCNLLETDADNN